MRRGTIKGQHRTGSSCVLRLSLLYLQLRVF